MFHYWLLLTASYDILNANANWKCQSGKILLYIWLTQLPYIPQLFKNIDNGKKNLLVTKIVDDVLVTGKVSDVDGFIRLFNQNFTLGTFLHGPQLLRFYGLNIYQHEDYSVSINATDNIEALEPFPLSIIRRRKIEEPLNSIVTSSYTYLNSSIGWLGMAASRFCSFYASFLQQKIPALKVSDFISKDNSLRTIKKLGTSISFPRLTQSENHNFSIILL